MTTGDEGMLPGHEGLTPLVGDPARQAMPAIRGYVYQIWRSVEMWLQIESASDVVFLEGAEDIDTVGNAGATTTQVKHESESISLNNARAHEAIKNFWTLTEREPSRIVQFHYMTTAYAAQERDGEFDGMPGIKYWRVAQTDLQAAEKIRKYLAEKISGSSPVGAFLLGASAGDFQTKLVRRFHWFLEQPEIEDIKQRVEDLLVVRLKDRSATPSQTEAVRDRLYGFVFDRVLEREPDKRRLNLADLIRQVDSILKVYLPVTTGELGRLASLLAGGGSDPGKHLLQSLVLPVPDAPSPLLDREFVVAKVLALIRSRTTVLLTGGVFRGKTTLAQLAAKRECPNASWFSAASQSGSEVAKLLNALAASFQDDAAPAMVVIDDLDVSAQAYRAYQSSLDLLIGRASRSGVAVLITASGTASLAAQFTRLPGVVLFDTPEMETEEVEQQCRQHGCPADMAPFWGGVIHGFTRGHPKLVQVRINSLAVEGWQVRNPGELLSEPATSSSAKEIARHLFSANVSEAAATFGYTAAESTTAFTRPMLLHLARQIDERANEGDIVDGLIGRWLEEISPGGWRITPMLQGSAAAVWLPDRQLEAHRRLFDSISSAGTLDVTDAAALVFHAFIARDESRLFECVQFIERIQDTGISGAVLQRLIWIPFVSLDRGQRFFEANVMVSAFLRQLQFNVATALDSETLAAVADRWEEEAARVEPTEVRCAMQVYMWSRFIASENRKIVPLVALSAISKLSRVTGDIALAATAGVRLTISQMKGPNKIVPPDASDTQFYFALRASMVRSLEELDSVLDWLETETDECVRQALDSILELPLVQSVGAYVHGAWANGVSDDRDWNSTIERLTRADLLARKLGMPRYGREVAKARAIVTCEYLKEADKALAIIDEAEQFFGNAVTLLEQRVNILFQKGDDQRAIAAWSILDSDPHIAKQLDAFAYRRAGISAARIKEWEAAEQYFLTGSKANPELEMVVTRFGLVADACHVAASGGQYQRAARRLSDLMLELPEGAFEDGNEDWDSVLRAVTSIAGYIGAAARSQDTSKNQIEYGIASAPGARYGKSEHTQMLRTQLTIARVGMVASELGSIDSAYRSHLKPLAESSIPLVRLHGLRSLVSLEFCEGPTSAFAGYLVDLVNSINRCNGFSDKEDVYRPDDGARPVKPDLDEREWFALFAAGAFCSGDVQNNLSSWAATMSATFSGSSLVCTDLEQVTVGVNLSPANAWSVIKSRDSTRGVYFGATMRALSTAVTPETVLSLQKVVSSATFSQPLGILLRETFERALAARFAASWQRFACDPFRLTAPRTTVPPLLAAIGEVERGTGSLDQLMAAAGRAVGK